MTVTRTTTRTLLLIGMDGGRQAASRSEVVIRGNARRHSGLHASRGILRTQPWGNAYGSSTAGDFGCQEQKLFCCFQYRQGGFRVQREQGLALNMQLKLFQMLIISK
jgi:hypothetical protein